MQNRKRDKCTEQTFRLWKKARVRCSERTALKKYTVKGETGHHPRLDA